MADADAEAARRAATMVPEGALTATQATARTRPTRDTEVRQERRRRSSDTLDRHSSLKLAVPDHIRQQNPGYAFRWINDVGNRMHSLTVLDDWDKVEGVAPIPVDTDREGKPVYGHLCRKKQEFFAEDQRAKRQLITEREQGLLRGTKTDAEANPEAVSYVPAGNRIASTG